MSALLLRYSRCFVFIADYRRMLEDRKRAAIDFCALGRQSSFAESGQDAHKERMNR